MHVVTEQSHPLPVPSGDPFTSLQQAGVVLHAFLADTGLGTRHQRGQLLEALAKQAIATDSARQPLLQTAYLKELISPGNSKEPSAWMSPLWSQLVKEEASWRTGLEETARRLGLAFLPKLVKSPGSPAMYGIEPASLPVPAGETLTDVPLGGLRYTTEQTMQAALWLRWLVRGDSIRWSWLPRIAMVGWFFVLLGIVILLLMLAQVRASGAAGPLTFGDLWLIVVMGTYIWIVRQYDRFFSELFDMRIVMAPVIVTRFLDQGVTLELLRAENGEKDGRLVLSKYSARCTRCDSAVEISEGGRAFPDRLVGRCRRSPREHVYSFDPVHRVGAPLN